MNHEKPQQANSLARKNNVMLVLVIYSKKLNKWTKNYKLKHKSQPLTRCISSKIAIHSRCQTSSILRLPQLNYYSLTCEHSLINTLVETYKNLVVMSNNHISICRDTTQMFPHLFMSRLYTVHIYISSKKGQGWNSRTLPWGCNRINQSRVYDTQCQIYWRLMDPSTCSVKIFEREPHL